MGTWRDVNRDSWTFSRKAVFGAGGGAGIYRISYAIDLEPGQVLNGKISADIRLVDRYATGAGLVCRADDSWSFISFYVAPSEKAATSTVARLGAMRYGNLVPIAVASEPVLLEDDYAHFSLEFFSGQLRGVIRSGSKTYSVSARASHVPFSGFCGLLKMYGAEVVATNILIERTEMQFSASHVAKQNFDFDVFLCHSSADKPVVLDMARAFRDNGIRYWLDSEQIDFGASITQKIEDGLKRSKFIVPCLSENLSKSGWTRAEYGAILNAEFSGTSERVVVPVKVSDALSDSAIPLLLRDKKRVLYTNSVEFGQFLAFLRNT